MKPPSLTREIADSYEMNPQEYKEDLFQLNQSVVLFITPPGEYVSRRNECDGKRNRQAKSRGSNSQENGSPLLEQTRLRISPIPIAEYSFGQS